MRTSPSIAPHGLEQDTYLVLDDFGADELRRRYTEFGEVPESILDFMDANRR